MDDMQKYIQDADMNKIALIVEIHKAYEAGAITQEAARRRMREEVKRVTPSDIALAEQQMKECHENFQEKEKIQEMLVLFEEVLVEEKPALDRDHPIACYLRENDAMRKILLEIEDLVQYPVIRNQWHELYDRLTQFRIHLSRKQNQLYSLLEKKGFDRPTTIMWTLDDYIRDEIRDLWKLLEDGDEEAFIRMQPTLVEDIRDLISKEESVLYPTSLKMISNAEFEEMKSGDREIGFAWIETSALPERNVPETASANESEFVRDLSKLLGKYGLGKDQDEVLDVRTGKLTLDQINLIFRHLPVDISYVDENEIVKFYSDTEHRVFPRSKNVIGRDVKNCHPKASVHVVKEILDRFRSGEKDTAEFWINKENFFVYIKYVAVRDDAGNFRGVLEMMQDALYIRSLEGSRTLLTWNEDAGGAEKKEKAEDATAAAPSVEPPQTTVGSGAIEISAETKLSDLLARYPWMKEELVRLRPNFKMLNTPLARIMIPKATVAMMSERGEIALDELIQAMKKMIAARAG